MSRRITFVTWIGIGVFATLAIVGVFFVRPAIQIRQYDSAYILIGRGASRHLVISYMGPPNARESMARAVFWNGKPLNEEEVARIRSTLNYYVRCGPGIVWSFSFDDEGKLIGKHRFD